MCPYTAGGRSRRGSPKAGTTVVLSLCTGGAFITLLKEIVFNIEDIVYFQD